MFAHYKNDKNIPRNLRVKMLDQLPLKQKASATPTKALIAVAITPSALVPRKVSDFSVAEYMKSHSPIGVACIDKEDRFACAMEAELDMFQKFAENPRHGPPSPLILTDPTCFSDAQVLRTVEADINVSLARLGASYATPLPILKTAVKPRAVRATAAPAVVSAPAPVAAPIAHEPTAVYQRELEAFPEEGLGEECGWSPSPYKPTPARMGPSPVPFPEASTTVPAVAAPIEERPVMVSCGVQTILSAMVSTCDMEVQTDEVDVFAADNFSNNAVSLSLDLAVVGDNLTEGMEEDAKDQGSSCYYSVGSVLDSPGSGVDIVLSIEAALDKAELGEAVKVGCFGFGGKKSGSSWVKKVMRAMRLRRRA